MLVNKTQSSQLSSSWTTTASPPSSSLSVFPCRVNHNVAKNLGMDPREAGHSRTTLDCVKRDSGQAAKDTEVFVPFKLVKDFFDVRFL